MTTRAHPHFDPPPEPEIEEIELDAGHFFSEEFGTTAVEQRGHEPMDDRLRREEPDDDGADDTTDEVDTSLPARAANHLDEPSQWNLIVTVRPGGEAAARALVGRFGALLPSPYPGDVLLARVDDAFDVLDAFDTALRDDAAARNAIARVLPAQHTFACASLDELERATRDLVGDWLDELADASFHVRCHPRGAHDIDGPEEEAFLGEVVLQELEERGTPGKIEFDDPDAVIDVETLGGEAAISVWTRDDLRAYPFLRVE